MTNRTGGAPFVPEGAQAPPPAAADPLPQALILTAIVISLGVLAFTIVMIARAHQAVGSDDVVAMGQPAVIEFVQHHVEEAIEQAEGEVELEQLDRVYRALLVEVIALSHAVAGPRGENHSKLMS